MASLYLATAKRMPSLRLPVPIFLAFSTVFMSSVTFARDMATVSSGGLPAPGLAPPRLERIEVLNDIFKLHARRQAFNVKTSIFARYPVADTKATFDRFGSDLIVSGALSGCQRGDANCIDFAPDGVLIHDVLPV